MLKIRKRNKQIPECLEYENCELMEELQFSYSQKKKKRKKKKKKKDMDGQSSFNAAKYVFDHTKFLLR